MSKHIVIHGDSASVSVDDVRGETHIVISRITSKNKPTIITILPGQHRIIANNDTVTLSTQEEEKESV